MALVGGMGGEVLNPVVLKGGAGQKCEGNLLEVKKELAKT